jgi:hypothetical protein
LRNRRGRRDQPVSFAACVGHGRSINRAVRQGTSAARPDVLIDIEGTESQT